jgi:anaerobic selenocysteine-containing dehydrogenase
MHNLLPLVKGKERCTLHIHPSDAARLGLSEEALATVANATGSVDVQVEITDDILPGVVSLPHGWSQNHDGMRMEVSRQHAGVLNNFLSPGDLLDEISGNAVLNGIPVTVSRAHVADRADTRATEGAAR